MRLKIHLIIILGTLFTTSVIAQSDFKKGLNYYKNRAEGAVNLQVSDGNINKALFYFEKVIEQNNDEEAAVYFMKSSYFKAIYCYPEGDKKRKEILTKGKEIGKLMVEKHPKSAPIRYYYAVMLGSWAKESGVVAAAKEGIIDKLKNEIEKVIEYDPLYEDGAGYRFLAILNLDAPYIPFFLTWPDNNEAVKLFEKSLAINPNHVSGQYYYAKALNEVGEKNKAIEVLKKVVQQSPSAEKELEETSELNLAKDLLQSLIK